VGSRFGEECPDCPEQG